MLKFLLHVFGTYPFRGDEMKKQIVGLFVGVLFSLSASAQQEKKVANQSFKGEGATEEAAAAAVKNQIDAFVAKYNDPKYSISVSYQDAADEPTTTVVNGQKLGEKKVGGRKLKLFARPVVIIDKCRGNKWQFPIALKLQGVKKHRVPIYEKVKQTAHHWSAEGTVLVTEIVQEKKQEIVYRVIPAEINVPAKVIPKKGGSSGVNRKPAAGGTGKRPAKVPGLNAKGETYEVLVDGKWTQVSKDKIPAGAKQVQ